MRRSLLLLLPMLWLTAGCATRRDMPLDLTLFPTATVLPESQTPGRVAIRMQPAVQDLVHEGEDGPARRMRIPIGQIVTQALLTSASEAFAGGAERLATSSAVDTRFVATLSVQSARASYHSHLLWFIPLGFLGAASDFELDSQLALDISLLDAGGRVVWTRSYDDGPRIWHHEWFEMAVAPDGLMRMTHEAAWRISQRVMHDLREWAEVERTRPRTL